MDRDAIDRFGAAAAAAEGALPWAELEPLYCEGDARGFFDDERVAGMRDTALAIATDLDRLLGGARPAGAPRAPRRTLFVGAAVAELWVVLFERIVMGRRYVWVNLPGPEARALDVALAAAEGPAGVELPRIRTGPWNRAEVGPCDHLWLCSVLTDPERFPALHDELYGRIGTPEAKGGGHPKRERAAARDLALRALECLAPDALVSTTDEELMVLRPLARTLGATLSTPHHGQTTALVGDVLRHCRWQREH